MRHARSKQGKRSPPRAWRCLAAVVALFAGCQFPDYGFGPGSAGASGSAGTLGGSAGSAPETLAGAGAGGAGGLSAAGGAGGAAEPSGGQSGAAGAAGAGGAAPELCVGPIPPGATCEGYGGHEYYFFPGALDTYQVAEASCANFGMELAIIEDTFENDWLKTTSAALGSSSFWTAGNDRKLEGQWQWAEGARFWSGTFIGSPVNGAYTAWGFEEPNSDGSCMLAVGGEWQDVDCLQSADYVCERQE